ncbi:hypothetical protein HDZ31DRAFT_84825 [Schizophyllum fasciatum]
MAFDGTEFGDFNVPIDKNTALHGMVDDFSTGQRQPFDEFDPQPRTAERHFADEGARSEYHAPQGAPSSGTNEYAMRHYAGASAAPGSGRYIEGGELGAQGGAERFQAPIPHPSRAVYDADEQNQTASAKGYGQPSAMDKIRDTIEDMAVRLTGNAEVNDNKKGPEV